MPFKVPFGKYGDITCDTMEEAIELARKLEAELDGTGEFPPGNRPRHLGPWTEEKFDTFLHRLGPDQATILVLLAEKKRVSAEELRACIGVASNQALAGTLSGISKQAEALGIGAREVFVIENRRRAGVLHKSFAIADELLKFTQDIGWAQPSKAAPLDNA